GLNVAMYKSTIVDKAFADLFASTDPEKKKAAIQSIQSDIGKNAPVAFLYSPLYLEARRDTLQGQTKNTGIVLPSDRFRDAYNWYIETEKVWNFLIKN
ncbi:MAG TPA: hypothetical protein PK950_01675, partial [Candidatus Paceibacterota bacterium]|nr:hypothetical protein [Candidatus Paceibacterota bacterium]